MSVREYIGARYVPLFADPIDWDSTKTYEPLTVVYNQGSSYTSRQYVPAGIDISNDTYWARTGNYNAQIEQYRSEVATFDDRITTNETNLRNILPFDETPTEGSAKGVTSDGIKKAIDTAEQTNADAIAIEVTRATNAEQTNADAIANEVTRATNAEQTNADAIANEVSTREGADTQIRTDFTAADTALGAKISTLESIPFNGDVVLLGDSYGEGYNPDGNVTSWIEMATTALNRRGVNVYSRYLGGIGIVTEHDGVNFATLLDQLGDSLTDAQKKKVGTVYIGGGWNDGYIPSVSDFRTGINAIENYAHSHFSNAKIIYDWFGFGNWLVNSSVANRAKTTTSSIKNAFEAVKTSNFKNVSLLDSTYLLRRASYFASDGIHPTLSGQQKLANHVIDVLAGVFDVDAKRYGHVSDTPINGMVNGSIDSTTATIVKNDAFVFNQTNAFLKGKIILSTAIPVSFGGAAFTLYTSNENALVFGTETFDIPITICVELQDSNAGIKGAYLTVNGFLHFNVNTEKHRLEMTFYAKNATPDGTDYLRGKLKQIQFPV